MTETTKKPGCTIRLISMDLDGTYLGNDKRILPENEAAIQRAAEAGIWVVPCSGRLMQAMPKPLLDAPYIRYYIGANGALIYDKKEDSYLYEQLLTRELVEILLREGKRPGILYDCYGRTSGWIDETVVPKLADHLKAFPHVARTIPTIRTWVKDFDAFLLDGNQPVSKFQYWFSDFDLRNQVMRELSEKYPLLNVSASMKCSIEITHRDANKGNGLTRLVQHLGIDLKDCMAFGDGLNDMEMITAVGQGYAMANGEEPLLMKAERIAPSNEECGIAQVIAREIFGE